MTKKILVYTGGRANYSSTKPIMKAIDTSPDLELINVIGGPALSTRYGNITELMHADGLSIDASIPSLLEGENLLTMAISTGLSLVECAPVFVHHSPDYVLVVGDRYDILPPAIASAFLNIPLVHTMGGEISGTIDESIRHAISKLAHIHFPANDEARQRLIRLGEDPRYVFNVGCPRNDYIKEILESTPSERSDLNSVFTVHKGVGPSLDIESNQFLLVSFHPVTTEIDSMCESIDNLLAALNHLSLPTVMLWPNSDAGSYQIAKAIRTFRENHKPEWLHLFTNLPFDVYIQLMKATACLVGNSSSGIREGALIGTPVVNIGTRQNARARSSNVIDSSDSVPDIISAIKHQLAQPKYSSSSLYGSGNASQEIVRILSTVEPPSIQKRLQY